MTTYTPDTATDKALGRHLYRYDPEVRFGNLKDPEFWVKGFRFIYVYTDEGIHYF